MVPEVLVGTVVLPQIVVFGSVMEILQGSVKDKSGILSQCTCDCRFRAHRVSILCTYFSSELMQSLSASRTSHCFFVGSVMQQASCFVTSLKLDLEEESAVSS